ncbi:dentin sialophosphoprotein [Planococcus citri]|uniref:dentin sialophosphoprotein n=1 Tax=Planococcus citri TaxID=170843 RepID=UPI0031F8EFDF
MSFLVATMKLSEQLDSTETRTKKRKRESVSIGDRSDQNVDDLNTRSPSKRTKQTAAEQDVSKVSPGDKNQPKDNNTSRLQSPCDSTKKKINETSPDIKSVKRNLTELIGSCDDGNSTILNTPSEPCDQRISPKKKKKKKKSESIEESDILSSNKSLNFPASTSANDDEKIDTVDTKNDTLQSELSSPKKNKKQKKIDKISNENLNESKSTSSNKSTDSTDNVPDSRSDISNVTEDSCKPIESSLRTSPRKAKKNKIDENVNESESTPSTDSANTTNADLPSHPVSDDAGEITKSPEKISHKKSKKKKNKIDKNSNVSKEIVFAEPSENTLPGSDSSAIPLKSCLKKKKRKTKKKKNQSGQQSSENSFDNDKKLANRSVSFDNNVKIELIENCLSKPVIEKTPATPANARKKVKASSYLKCWKEDRQNWKFEKLTQLWLIKNMLQEDMVPGEEFEYFQEYLVDLKGAARKLVIDLCNKVISFMEQKQIEEEKMEQKPAEEENKELQTAYTRARAVQQLIPEMQDKQ